MLGRLLGHSPGLWQRVAWLVLCPARAAGSKAKNAQDTALQTADPGYTRGCVCLCQAVPWIMRQGAGMGCSQMDKLAGKGAFRNERRPTNFDKKVLVWSGRFKKEEDIPRHISSDILNTARSKVRIKVCYIMIALTVLGCVTMIITGKEAVKKDQTLLRVNAEKKAKWRAEVKKSQDTAAGKSQ